MKCTLSIMVNNSLLYKKSNHIRIGYWDMIDSWEHCLWSNSFSTTLKKDKITSIEEYIFSPTWDNEFLYNKKQSWNHFWFVYEITLTKRFSQSISAFLLRVQLILCPPKEIFNQKSVCLDNCIPIKRISPTVNDPIQ